MFSMKMTMVSLVAVGASGIVGVGAALIPRTGPIHIQATTTKGAPVGHVWATKYSTIINNTAPGSLFDLNGASLTLSGSGGHDHVDDEGWVNYLVDGSKCDTQGSLVFTRLATDQGMNGKCAQAGKWSVSGGSLRFKSKSASWAVCGGDNHIIWTDAWYIGDECTEVKLDAST